MYVKQRSSGELVEVLDMQALIDPSSGQVQGRFHAGEEMPDARTFAKDDLVFPSDESLPRCWLDPNYRH